MYFPECNFDVTIGAHNRGEICELIGIFMFSLLSKHIIKIYIGLYRADGLAILKNTGSPETEKLKKCLKNYLKKKIKKLLSSVTRK